VNIFVLDGDPSRCARFHCDSHVVKMILEGAQMLCTSSDSHGTPVPYKPTHRNHPCTLWAGESLSNWKWLRMLTLALGREYLYRYPGKPPHASVVVAESLRPPRIPDLGLTPFAQAMPEEYRIPGDAVTAYRRYYIAEKRSIAVWTRRKPPRWFTEGVSRNG
jgi:hypothetical protein